MELLQDEKVIEALFAIVMIIFMLWLVPQAVGSKPFFMDLFEDHYKAQTSSAAEAQELP